MPVTRESLAARLDRIESALKSRRSLAPSASSPLPSRAAYTPREFSRLIGRSYRWTVDQCAARTIRTLTARAPYLIPAAELTRFATGGRRAVLE